MVDSKLVYALALGLLLLAAPAPAAADEPEPAGDDGPGQGVTFSCVEVNPYEPSVEIHDEDCV